MATVDANNKPITDLRAKLVEYDPGYYTLQRLNLYTLTDLENELRFQEKKAAKE